MRYFFALLFFLAAPSFAMADDNVVLGQSCDTIGITLMTSDGKNIAACLLNDAGNAKIWKSLTPSDIPSGTWCGFGKISSTAREGVYLPYYTNVFSCNGRSLGDLNCPSGFYLMMFHSYYSFYACYKNYYCVQQGQYYTCVKS